MKLNVRAPEKFIGDVLSDLSSQRRGQIQTVTAALDTKRASRSSVDAIVPLANMVGYATALRSKTKGEADFSMSFSHYMPTM